MKNQSNNIASQELTITQKELQRLQELEKVKLEAEQLRQSIKQRALNGAKVEPGELKVFFNDYERTKLTQQTIHELLGKLGDEILAALPKLKIYQMHVRPSRSSNHQTEPAAVVDPSTVSKALVPGEESELVDIVVDALTAIDGSNTNKPKEDNRLLTMVKLKIEMLEYARNSQAESHEEEFAFAEDELSELGEF